MIEKNDIIDFLFDKQEDDDLLALDDEIKSNLYESNEILENKIMKFIDKRVHPKTKEKLKQLIKQKEKKSLECLHRENQLFYRNGVADGVQFILTALSMK